MDHVDIEVSDGSILIFTDGGEMLEMTAEPSSEGVIKVMSSRPPSAVTVRAGDDGRHLVHLVHALEELGHEVSTKVAVGPVLSG